jgi:hypothetical protein
MTLRTASGQVRQGCLHPGYAWPDIDGRQVDLENEL